MEIIKPELIVVNENATTKVEIAARTAYQSMDKMTDDSAEKLFKFCFDRGHLSIFEHHYVHIVLERACNINFDIKQWFNHKYMSIEHDKYNNTYHMRGNIRCFMDIFYSNVQALFDAYTTHYAHDTDDRIRSIRFKQLNQFYEMFSENRQFSQDFYKEQEERFAVLQFVLDVVNNVFPDNHGKFIQIIPNVKVVDNSEYYNSYYANLKGFMSSDTNYYTFKVVTDIGVGREWLRHNIRGVTQESTRYCNYQSKGFKIIYPQPLQFAEEFGKVVESEGKLYPITGKNADKLTKEQKHAKLTWMALDYVNKKYDELIALGVPPQEARMILPLGLKAEFVITGHWMQWAHFCFMRADHDAHPQIRILANEVYKFFNNTLTDAEFETFNRIAQGLQLVSTTF